MRKADMNFRKMTVVATWMRDQKRADYSVLGDCGCLYTICPLKETMEKGEVEDQHRKGDRCES